MEKRVTNMFNIVDLGEIPNQLKLHQIVIMWGNANENYCQDMGDNF